MILGGNYDIDVYHSLVNVGLLQEWTDNMSEAEKIAYFNESSNISHVDEHQTELPVNADSEQIPEGNLISDTIDQEDIHDLVSEAFWWQSYSASNPITWVTATVAKAPMVGANHLLLANVFGAAKTTAIVAGGAGGAVATTGAAAGAAPAGAIASVGWVILVIMTFIATRMAKWAAFMFYDEIGKSVMSQFHHRAVNEGIGYSENVYDHGRGMQKKADRFQMIMKVLKNEDFAAKPFIKGEMQRYLIADNEDSNAKMAYESKNGLQIAPVNNAIEWKNEFSKSNKFNLIINSVALSEELIDAAADIFKVGVPARKIQGFQHGHFNSHMKLNSLVMSESAIFAPICSEIITRFTEIVVLPMLPVVMGQAGLVLAGTAFALIEIIPYTYVMLFAFSAPVWWKEYKRREGGMFFGSPLVDNKSIRSKVMDKPEHVYRKITKPFFRINNGMEEFVSNALKEEEELFRNYPATMNKITKYSIANGPRRNILRDYSKQNSSFDLLKPEELASLLVPNLEFKYEFNEEHPREFRGNYFRHFGKRRGWAGNKPWYLTKANGNCGLMCTPQAATVASDIYPYYILAKDLEDFDHKNNVNSKNPVDGEANGNDVIYAVRLLQNESADLELDKAQFLANIGDYSFSARVFEEVIWHEDTGVSSQNLSNSLSFAVDLQIREDAQLTNSKFRDSYNDKVFSIQFKNFAEFKEIVVKKFLAIDSGDVLKQYVKNQVNVFSSSAHDLYISPSKINAMRSNNNSVFAHMSPVFADWYEETTSEYTLCINYFLGQLSNFGLQELLVKPFILSPLSTDARVIQLDPNPVMLRLQLKKDRSWTAGQWLSSKQAQGDFYENKAGVDNGLIFNGVDLRHQRYYTRHMNEQVKYKSVAIAVLLFKLNSAEPVLDNI